MEVVLILFGVAGLVLFLAMGQHLSLSTGALLVVLIGTTFGHSFFKLEWGPIPLTIDRILWAWMIFAGLILWKLNRADPKPINRTDMTVIGLTLMLITSTFMHDWQYKENLPLSRLLFFNLLPIGFYFIGKHCRLKTQHLTVFYSILALFGVYLAFTGIAEQQNWYAFVFPRYILDPQYWEFLGRARGPFLNPVSCGIYLVVCLIGTAFMWPRMQIFGKCCVVGAVGIMVMACMLTMTRSVWLGCLVAVAALAWLPSQPRIRGAYVVLAAVGMTVVIFGFSDKLNRFQRDKDVTIEAMAQSAALRPMLMFVAYKMFRDKPVVGHGFGQYTAAKKPYHYHDTNEMQLSKILPYMQHNVFLSYLTETGLIGMTMLIVLLTSMAFKGWLLWRSGSLPLAERQFGLLAFLFVANYCINGMFHDVSIIPHVGAIFFLLLGINENVFSSQVQVAGIITPEDHSNVASEGLATQIAA